MYIKLALCCALQVGGNSLPNFLFCPPLRPCRRNLSNHHWIVRLCSYSAILLHSPSTNVLLTPVSDCSVCEYSHHALRLTMLLKYSRLNTGVLRLIYPKEGRPRAPRRPSLGSSTSTLCSSQPMYLMTFLMASVFRCALLL